MPDGWPSPDWSRKIRWLLIAWGSGWISKLYTNRYIRIFTVRVYGQTSQGSEFVVVCLDRNTPSTPCYMVEPSHYLGQSGCLRTSEDFSETKTFAELQLAWTCQQYWTFRVTDRARKRHYCISRQDTHTTPYFVSWMMSRWHGRPVLDVNAAWGQYMSYRSPFDSELFP